jgi:Na+-driven multidrug efflux pump
MVAVCVVLALILGAGVLLLLAADTFFLADRWDPREGHLFAGASRYLLAGCLAAFGMFALFLGRDWLRGAVPSERGAIVLRYWPVVVIAVACLVGAFVTAERVPNPALRPTSLLAP